MTIRHWIAHRRFGEKTSVTLIFCLKVIGPNMALNSTAAAKAFKWDPLMKSSVGAPAGLDWPQLPGPTVKF
jgi:hypothetical protein